MTEKPNERLAARIVANATGMTVQRADIRSHEGKHDYDLLLPDGTLGAALEVTTEADEAKRSLLAAIDRHSDRLTIGRAVSETSWQVTLRWGSDVKRVVRNVRKLAYALSACEGTGKRFIHATRDRHHPSVGVLRRAFPEVRFASAYTRMDGEPIIEIIFDSVGGAIGPGTINPFVRDFLASRKCEDVRGKLARTHAPERHAFVWVDVLGGFSVHQTLCDEEMPTDPPSLPADITHVWLAAFGKGDEPPCWRATEHEAWERAL